MLVKTFHLWFFLNVHNNFGGTININKNYYYSTGKRQRTHY